jgi:quercetin dioxygenase-like cupin family protein
MWNLVELDAPAGTRDPIVLHSEDGARAVMIRLEPGQELGDHQVKEHAWVCVVEGEVRVVSGEDDERCGVGTLLSFAPDERHAIATDSGARILMLLAPWPGEGHYRGQAKTA